MNWMWDRIDRQDLEELKSLSKWSIAGAVPRVGGLVGVLGPQETLEITISFCYSWVGLVDQTSELTDRFSNGLLFCVC